MRVLLICADCQCASPDTEGDTRQVFGTDYGLCETCAADWDANGIPTHIAADHAG